MQVYKCEKCGNIVLMLHGGAGALICCGEPMGLLDEQTADMAVEKHVPVIEETEDGYFVKVGSVPHPMEAQHYIEWIELVVGPVVHRKFLKPGDAPEASFRSEKSDSVYAREYCNIHKLWRG